MTEFRIRVLLAVLACQAVLLLWAMGLPRRREVTQPIYRVVVLAAAQLMAVVMFVAGAELDSAYQWWHRLGIRRMERPEVQFQASGDPSLFALLKNQDPSPARPPLDQPLPLAAWREKLRQELREEVFGWSGAAGRPVYEVQESVMLDGGVRRRLITYRARDGTAIPAYHFQPAGTGPFPAVLVLAGHGQGIVETAGLVHSYQHGAARELARAGFVTLTPEFRGFGLLGPPAHNEHNFTAYNALLAGTFYKAVLVKDLAVAMDLLRSLPSVDSARVAVTGASFGGEMSVTYAALDPRIRAVVAQAWTGEAIGKEIGAGGAYPNLNFHLCHIVPRHNEYLLGEDWFLLVAPRPLLLVRGDQDRGRDPSAMLGAAYTALGRPDHFRFEVEPGGHEYFLAPAVRFLRANL